MSNPEMCKAYAAWYDRQARNAAARGDFKTACERQEMALALQRRAANLYRADISRLHQRVEFRRMLAVRQMTAVDKTAWLGRLIQTAVRPRERRDSSSSRSSSGGGGPDSDDPSPSEPHLPNGGAAA